MAYITLNVNSSGTSVGTSNDIVLNGDSTKREEVLQNIINFLTGLQAGTIAGTVSVSTSSAATTVTVGSGGTAAFTLNFS